MSTTTVYRVRGMTRGHCVGSVTSELATLASLTDVEVSLDAGEATVTSDTPLDDDAVRAAVDETGYEFVT